ncbi:MAG: efflux RND transporter periplasmic adaptor subunit [Alphaproteobacteria bacterium]|nr:efflux RND transporter periplasmic adaptor subunit [Alphaproteobacteria bacterium]
MITRYLLPLLGIVGLVAGVIFAQTYGSPKAPPPNQLSMPPSAPYSDTVSGTGLVEASSRNIDIGSHESGVVSRVAVKEGDRVQAGDVLFALDDRIAKAMITQRESEVAAATANIANSRAALDDVQDQLKRAEGLSVGKSISMDELQRRRFAVKRAAAAVTASQAEHESAQAALQSARVTLSRLSVTAPTAGRILKVRISPGEYINLMGGGAASILMGEDSPLYLRVEVDENDVWRFKPDAKATASLRSKKDHSYPLSFVRIEPYVQPKKNLNGDTSERVDTRVLEVVYRIDMNKDSAPLYIGQQMDVFIDGK